MGIVQVCSMIAFIPYDENIPVGLRRKIVGPVAKFSQGAAMVLFIPNCRGLPWCCLFQTAGNIPKCKQSHK